MPVIFLALHAAGIAAAVAAGRISMRSGLAAAAVAPAFTAIWAASRLIGSETPEVSELTWVGALGLSFRLRTDTLALMMVLLVSGIGALVFIYARGYFSPGAAGGTRFPATLLAFSTAMLGLVLSDSIWTLFIFWELTTVTSFLLVGHKHQYPDVQASARRALFITGTGGLVLLAGLLVLAQDVGTTTLTDLPAASGGAATLAAILIMIGAATKSAQVPFHIWLPGAMAAPTPVSAYLHSATMVKAGVFLVASVGPAFVDVTAWKTAGLAFGSITMVWGAIGALRHRDAKLILAWGTVSQLGLMFTVFSLGTGKAVFAGISLLFAHAIFKAPLFLVVGEIDIRTGTRIIDELGGLRKKMPVAFGVAVTAALSMMGVPPLLGFTAKESAIEAGLGVDGFTRVVSLGAIIGGSVLTVAYTLRFLITVFGDGPDTEVAPRQLAMTIPAVILGSLSFLGYVFANIATAIVRPAAVELNESAVIYSLIRWPGIKTAFVISMGIVLGGLIVGWFVSKPNERVIPRPIGADATDRGLDGFLDMAPDITRRIQHGSLPVYVVIMVTATSAAAVPFFNDLSLNHVVLWDSPIQGVLALATVAAAIFGAFVKSRLGAAMTLGAVGFGMTGLFVVQGAPDLALTQLLVETIIVVGFVLGLGHLSRQFPVASDSWKSIRLAVALTGGIAVTGALIASGASPVGEPPIDALAAQSVEIGGGNNVVNVILTDLRALDTLGEVIVLATAAVGVLALARAQRTDSQEPASATPVSGKTS